MGLTRFTCPIREAVAGSEAARTASVTFARGRSAVSRALAAARAAASALLAPCGAFEWIALSYLALSGIMMIAFHQNLPHALSEIATHFGVLAAILGIVNLAALLERRRPDQPLHVRAAIWVRDWYPQMIFLFCFEELRILVHLIYPDWRDSVLISFDHWLTGVYPAVWLARFSGFWTNEVMQIAYMSYFLFLTILGTSLYRRRFLDPMRARSSDPAGAKAMQAFWTVITASMIGYSIGYVISIFFPIEAPFYAMRSFHLPVLAGGAATQLINFIESWGRVRGGAFPSAHVSGSTVALIGAWRYRRYLFWIFLPFFITMCISTIYGHYHYVADVFAGIAVGCVGFLIALRMMDLPGADPAANVRVQN
jgi:membrane-associated phospholipid phosphatase